MAKLSDRLRSRVRTARKRARFHNAHWWIDPYRVLTKRVEAELPRRNENLVKLANYSLDARVPLDAASVVYSAGVGTDIAFDLAVAHRFGCQVLLLDPTPDSADFMSRQPPHPGLTYDPVGLWIADEVVKFNTNPTYGGSARIEELGGDFDDGGGFEARCSTIETIMSRHGHTRIDVLKLDIEGAAMPVLSSMLDSDVRPGQVVAEFERPLTGALENARFFGSLMTTLDGMEDAGYEFTTLPREAARYFSLELLFTLRSAIGVERGVETS